MTCKINNTVNINFKNGASQILGCSYLSYSDDKFEVHGENHIILSAPKDDILSYTMTDNPVEIVEE